MSNNNLSSVLKSCSESELINEVAETNMTPKQVEGSRLKRTFTLPRNPFGTIKPSSSKIKNNDSDNKPCSASSVIGDSQKDEGVERKLFRRPSWKRFLNKIAHHMSTVNVSVVSISFAYLSKIIEFILIASQDCLFFGLRLTRDHL